MFGKVGKTIENTGPLTKKRMETVDEEFLASALDFMDRKTKEKVPWLCYFNPTRMHVFTHLKPASVGKTGHGVYPDGMVELDGFVGDLLKKVDELGVADNTIVVFTTDNGAEECIWPDGGATPFRGEKDTNWEGGWRVPCVMRWPGVIKAGEVINEMGSLTDFLRPSRPQPGIRTSSPSSRKDTISAGPRSRCISMATTCCRSCRARSRARAKASSTGATMAI